MLQMSWLESHIPNGTLDGGMDRVNNLYWNITIENEGERWRVRSGEDTIFLTDVREALDSFLYGLTLAYAVIPTDIFEHLKHEVTRIVE